MLNLSNKHFKDENSEPPPVNCPCVWRLCQHFGCQEFRSAAERRRPVAVTHSFLTQTKVGNLHKAVGVQQQVVQLQITTKTRIKKLLWEEILKWINYTNLKKTRRQISTLYTKKFQKLTQF